VPGDLTSARPLKTLLKKLSIEQGLQIIEKVHATLAAVRCASFSTLLLTLWVSQTKPLR
jgi:hypothetical protein